MKRLMETREEKTMRRNIYIAVLSAVVLLAGGCGQSGGEGGGTVSGTGEAVLGEDVSGETQTGSDGGEGTREETLIQEEHTQEMLRREALRQVESVDFTVQDSPVDMERYDEQTDRVYKEVFWKAVTNQIPVYGRNGEEPVFYRELLGETGKLPEDQFLRAVRESDYFYLDFDGDGLPELTIDTEGPCVLKYYPEEERVVLYARKEEGWYLLGKGQMYAEFTKSDEEARTNLYCYEAEGEEFCLKHVLYWHWELQQEPYLMSVGEYTDVAVDEETAQNLLGKYFAAAKQTPRPMTCSALFGDGEERGYMPGEEQPARYGLRDTDRLPVNEESGPEWEVYKAMMEGDFSIVEDERWVSLQDDYERDLERGDGTCSWSYFLMDFNQDGVRELVIRFDPEGVNNTAFFCCEDGRVKMWGSYGSADRHWYQVPLANGRILSVDWYQNDWQWWVQRVDLRCRTIREQSYCTWEVREDSDGGEGDGVCSGEAEGKRERLYEFWDYYHDGKIVRPQISLTEEEWGRIEDQINGLMIPEEVWKPCAVFTPRSDRPEIPPV